MAFFPPHRERATAETSFLRAPNSFDTGFFRLIFLLLVKLEELCRRFSAYTHFFECFYYQTNNFSPDYTDKLHRFEMCNLRNETPGARLEDADAITHLG
jgi:hypothetical protein